MPVNAGQNTSNSPYRNRGNKGFTAHHEGYGPSPLCSHTHHECPQLSYTQNMGDLNKYPLLLIIIVPWLGPENMDFGPYMLAYAFPWLPILLGEVLCPYGAHML